MRKFILLCALFIVCSSAAFAQEDKVTQGVVTTTTNTTYTTVTHTKQVRMSDEEWAEYKRQKREARRAAADSLRAVRLANMEQYRLLSEERKAATDSLQAIRSANMEQQRLARKEKLANRPPLTGGIGWKNYININITGARKIVLSDPRTSSPSIGIEYVGGKRFNRVLFLGFGTGVVFNTCNHNENVYETFNNTLSYSNLGLCKASFPLYANFRLYMASRKCQPYFSLSTGFRFSGMKTTDISNYDVMKSSEEKLYKFATYKVKYGTTQYFLSPGFGIDFLGKSGKGLSLQASLFAVTRPGMKAGYHHHWNDYHYVNIVVNHSMVVGYHVQIGFTF